MRIYSLYPKYNNQDRRIQTDPVDFERRSGIDRRSNVRVKLDPALTNDIFVLRNKVESQKEKEAVSFGSNNQIVSHMTNLLQPIKKNELKHTNNATNSNTIPEAGVLGGALASAMSIMFLGASGAVVALGAKIYIACKAVKNVIAQSFNKS